MTWNGMKRADEVREWPCLVCGRVMKSEMAEDGDCGKMRAVVSSYDGCGPAIDAGIDFVSSGNYGSTVADQGPMVTIIVCDACLRKHGDRVMVFDRHWIGGMDGSVKASDIAYTLTQYETKGGVK